MTPDPVDHALDDGRSSCDYDTATNLGPLSLRIYNGWRSRRLLRERSHPT